MSQERRGWLLALLLALLWGLGPALPALLRGEILGHPYTDLYPSVWGLSWFAAHQPGLPSFAPELGWPAGMGFYYSSPLHGWLAAPLLRLGLLDLAGCYNLGVVAARLAAVLLSYGWLRAEKLSPRGALAGAALFGCAPCFHGYAVEGIVEGTDAWTLALWGWLVARRRLLPACLAFWLIVASSWYLGLAGLLVAAVRAREHRVIALSALGGLLLALPLWWLFSDAFGQAEPLPGPLRAAMGTPLTVPRPGLLPGLNPFAVTSYLGWLACGLFLWGARQRPWLAAGAAACWLLSLGIGPWYELPGLQQVRWPYRLVAASLFLAAPVVGSVAAQLRWGTWVAAAVALEGLLLSPVEPILPGAPAQLPPIYEQVEPTVLLELPGPVAMPPGEINLSRPRARYLLYYQALHGAASPWTPDFNGLAQAHEPPWLASFRAFDPLVDAPMPASPPMQALRDAGIRQLMLHPKELGSEHARQLRAALLQAGAQLRAEDEEQQLYVLP